MNLFKSNLTEEQQKLWNLVLAKVEEIKSTDGAGHGSGRGVALLNAEGTSVSTVLELGQADGSTRVYFITAWQPNPYVLRSRGPSVEVKRWFHNSEPFWERQLEDRTDAAVIGGVHYRVRPEGDLPADCRGYGGQKFSIRFHDGREVTTTNLWCQGTIPPVFRDRMPDNAEFVSGGA